MGTYIPTAEELIGLKEAFSSIKAEDDKILQARMYDLFVTTSEYYETEVKGKSIVVGRKGSGKTAILLGYSHNHGAKYKSMSQIDADDIPITSLYNFYLRTHIRISAELVNKAKEINSEIEYTELASLIDPVRLSSHAWSKAFQNFAIYLAATHLLDENNCSNEERDILFRVTNTIRGQLDDKDVTAFLYALLTENYGEIVDLIQETVSSYVGNAWAKLISLITNRLLGRFREKPTTDFKNARSIINKYAESNEWNILITFDRFDDFYDKHYEDLQQLKDDHDASYLARRQVLSAILEGLILGVSEIKKEKDYEWLDILITIPMDKFMELDLRERARIELKNVIMLHWTPLELFDYANRRIAAILGTKIPEGKSPWYFMFPDTISNAAVKNIKEDSFLYLLRHTLWKPREVQMYILKLLERLFEGGIAFEDREVIFREAIAEQSRDIIRQEFNPEFKKQYPRLRNLFKQLQASKVYTVVPLSDLMDTLSGSSLSSDITDKTKVLRRLYYMGVVGVRKIFPAKQKNTEPTVTQSKQEVAYTFFFNSNDHDPFSPNSILCFHPMFFDEIGAEHREDYVVNELKWDMFRADGKNLKFIPPIY